MSRTTHKNVQVINGIISESCHCNDCTLLWYKDALTICSCRRQYNSVYTWTYIISYSMRCCYRHYLYCVLKMRMFVTNITLTFIHSRLASINLYSATSRVFEHSAPGWYIECRAVCDAERDLCNGLNLRQKFRIFYALLRIQYMHIFKHIDVYTIRFYARIIQYYFLFWQFWRIRCWAPIFSCTSG